MTRYWGQITFALAAALGVTYWLFSNGYGPLTAGLSGLVAYFLVRWLIAWLYRIEYWHNSGGIRKRNCAECGQYIYRKRGDWVPKCYRCGRTVGLPGVRWIRHSVPAVQLKRTVFGPAFVIVVIAVALLASGVAGQVALSEVSLPDGNSNDDAEDARETGTDDEGSGGQSSESSSDDDIVIDVPGVDVDLPTVNPSIDPDDVTISADQETNKTAVREAFMQRLNEARQERGLQTLSERAVLVEMGNQQAADMAENNYIGHEDSQGRTIEDRYRARGLLPECKLETTGNRFYPGAENAAESYIWQDLIRWWDDKIVSIDSEERLAEHLFNSWMNSSGHRKVMLLNSADEAGLGLAITDSNNVYAALEFC